MGERDGYVPGTFCWVELATTDQAAAKEFYAALFGWVADDRPVGEGSYYSMQQLDERVAGHEVVRGLAAVPAGDADRAGRLARGRRAQALGALLRIDGVDLRRLLDRSQPRRTHQKSIHHALACEWCAAREDSVSRRLVRGAIRFF